MICKLNLIYVITIYCKHKNANDILCINKKSKHKIHTKTQNIVNIQIILEIPEASHFLILEYIFKASKPQRQHGAGLKTDM